MERTAATQQTSENKLVSIILTTYNGEAHLATQLESLFAQTYQAVEIIAVDDGSTDKTVEILHAYAARHSNMKVFVNEQNFGYIKNFDKACSLSSGELLALCDQDDAWDKEKIAKMVAAIGDRPMIYCDSFICDAELQPTGRRISDNVNTQQFSSCLEQAVFCRIYGNATLITRQLYNQSHPFLLAIPHDWWLSFNATLLGTINYLHEPLVYYRQHAQNLFGAVGGKKSSKRKASLKKESEKQKIRERIAAFYEACPSSLAEEKRVLKTLKKSYQSFSLPNNLLRFATFLRYRDVFLKVKKHSALHRFFFCFKMLWKIK